MSSKLYQEVDWICPSCKNKNTNTFLEIETHPVECTICNQSFDIYLKVELNIEVLEVSNGLASDEDEIFIKKELKKASDSGKINKLDALEIMSSINSIKNN